VISHDSLFGVLAFFSFAGSVVAAVLAIDMYALSRTGEFGPTWRVLIIAAVMFALVQALRMVTFFDWAALERYGLSQIVELMFALCLAYAFYLQRRAFSSRSKLRSDNDEEPVEDSRIGDFEEVLEDEPVESAESPADANRASWPRLGR
jgi:hypothetical protein